MIESHNVKNEPPKDTTINGPSMPQNVRVRKIENDKEK